MFDVHSVFSELPKGRIAYTKLSRELQTLAAKHREDIPTHHFMKFLWVQLTGSRWAKWVGPGWLEIQDPRTPEATP